MTPQPYSLSGRIFKTSGVLVALALLVTALAIWQAARGAERWEYERLRRTGEARISLHADSLHQTLEKFRHIPYLLSRDPRIRGLLQGQLPPVRINPHLDDFAAVAGTLIFVMDKRGDTVATSNWRTEESLMGTNFAFRPYFQDALEGKSGGYYAVGFRTRKPGFFISYPVLETGRLLGVVVAKVDLEKLQESWRDSGETIIVSDGSGVVFLSSRPDWQYRSLRPLPESTALRLRQVQYLDRPLSTLATQRQAASGGNILDLDGRTFLEQSRQLLDYGWRIHYLSDLAPVATTVRLTMAVTAVVAIALLLVLLYLRERARSFCPGKPPGRPRPSNS